VETYSVLPKLFRAIENLNEEQQSALLRQLFKGRLKAELFKAVIGLSDAQQLTLLKRLEILPVEDEPIRTVSLDEEQSLMREHKRKDCLLNVAYSTHGQDFKDYILNISTVGVFIETDTPVPVGQEMALTFKLPNYQQPLTLEARAAWIGSKGVGVKFTNLSPYQEEIIRSYIEKEEAA
jgi:uncharacterized protein (TIGR02266 family)